MSRNNPGMSASQRYRALRREIRNNPGGNPSKLIEKARHFNDPYFASMALADIFCSGRLPIGRMHMVAGEVLKFARDEKRTWRRAELIIYIAGRIQSCGKKINSELRHKTLDSLLAEIEQMPAGQPLSDAICGTAAYLGPQRAKRLLRLAQSNSGFENSDAKAVIGCWAKASRDITADDLADILEAVRDTVMRARLTGYAHVQRRRQKKPTSINLLETAIDMALSLEAEKRPDAMRYLILQAETSREFALIQAKLEHIADSELLAGILPTLGGRLDKAGMKKEALEIFKKALSESEKVASTTSRVMARLNIAQGFLLSGDKDHAEEIYKLAKRDCENDPKLTARIERSILSGKPTPSSKKPAAEVKQAPVRLGKSGNHILALYDTYEGGIKPIHMRTIARAGPLCLAFGFDLALIGFPATNLKGLIEQTVTETNIGKAGRYIRKLYEQGRIVLVGCTSDEPPKDWKNLGLPVATTSRPAPEKRIDAAGAMQVAKQRHPRGCVCMIMGLGRRGLPKSMLSATRYHLELTGSDVPLETGTAMGVIAHQMYIAKKK